MPLISSKIVDMLMIYETLTRLFFFELPSVMPTKTLMPTMLVQEHKDKTITHMVHEVLTWFDQPCLHAYLHE